MPECSFRHCCFPYSETYFFHAALQENCVNSKHLPFGRNLVPLGTCHVVPVPTACTSRHLSGNTCAAACTIRTVSCKTCLPPCTLRTEYCRTCSPILHHVDGLL
jgi:hypothetical protein